MQNTRKYLNWAFLAVLAVAVVFAAAGSPLISPETWAALAAVGAMPVAVTGETGGDIRKMFDQLTDTAKAAKETVEQVRKAHTELDARVSKLHDELKTGGTDAVTKAAYQDAVQKVDKVEKSLDKINAEVAELAKKATGLLGDAGNQRKSLGQLAAASDAARNYKGGTVELCTMAGPLFAKAALTSGAASAGAFIQPERLPGLITAPDTPPTVRDLFMSVSVASGSIEWVREKLFTNNAGPQNGEGAAKPESAITFEKKSTPVETIAHWIPISRQVLADVPQLQGLVDGRLRQGLKMKEDLQLLLGDGTNGNLLGLIPQSTVYSSAGMPAVANGMPGYTKIDHMRWAFLQVARAQYPATFSVLSLEDWAVIQMMKTSEGAYIFGTPTDGAAPRIWGKTVVESHNLAANNFLAGSAFAATVYDREEVSVRVAEQHADFFIKNMVAMLCEERLALTVERPQAMVAGVFPA
ncbi:phage major capsid protein [Acidovorax sp. NCPPB 4044]|uniref:phage major capsid protein n=1 Tax=Acidovorax sp. NCPPB 4044 TaxID=2940490 RepID=UPI002303236F|nr:phage major capsid protein [Acidovorax sp. NCPPB 4044]MDA8522316.1 phage major capsid protein [Acidovorax sp. NCPPB 4044]